MVVTPAVAVGLIVIEAVTLVADTDVIVPLTPGLLDVTAEAALKSEPVKVTEKLLPSVPLVVLTDVSVGVAAALTVKLCDRVVPPTTRPSVVAPVEADELIVIEAVTLVAEALVILPLTPALPELTAEAALRFVPVNVTENVVPAVPLLGLKEVSVGAAAMTVNGCVTVVPPTTRPKVVAPAAAAELIVTEAVTLVADLDVMVPLTPAFAELTAVTALKFVPVNVTVNGALPAVPLAGLTEVSVGVAAAVVNVAA